MHQSRLRHYRTITCTLLLATAPISADFNRDAGIAGATAAVCLGAVGTTWLIYHLATRQQAQEAAISKTRIQIEQRYKTQQPLANSDNLQTLAAYQQQLTDDASKLDQAQLFWQNTEHTQQTATEKEKVTTLLKRIKEQEKIVGEKIALQIGNQAYDQYKEELQKLKSFRGLDEASLANVIIERYVREPYRCHAYLDELEQKINYCKQTRVPTNIVDLLELLRKRACHLLEPAITQERQSRQKAAQQNQIFAIELAKKEKMKQYFTDATLHLQEAKQVALATQAQIVHFSALMRQQSTEFNQLLKCHTDVINQATCSINRIEQSIEAIKTAASRESAQRQELLVKEMARLMEMTKKETNEIKRRLAAIERMTNGQGNNYTPPPAFAPHANPSMPVPSAPPLDA